MCTGVGSGNTIFFLAYLFTTQNPHKHKFGRQYFLPSKVINTKEITYLSSVVPTCITILNSFTIGIEHTLPTCTAPTVRPNNFALAQKKIINK